MTELVRMLINVSQTTKDKFNSLNKQETTSEQLLSELLQLHEIKSAEAENLKRVCEIRNMSLKLVVQEALRDYIKKTLNAAKKGLYSHKKSEQADKNIADIVNSIIVANDKAKERKDLIYINQTSITKWMRDNDKKMMNFKVIQRYLRLHAELLNGHHQKNNMSSSHNRESFMLKKTSGI